MIYLDTHVVISPTVELEIEYLFEIKKITERSAVIIDYMRKQIGLHISEAPFAEVVKRASLLKWTRDPFDRLITAQADIQETSLLTKDTTIHTHYPKAVW